MWKVDHSRWTHILMKMCHVLRWPLVFVNALWLMDMTWRMKPYPLENMSYSRGGGVNMFVNMFSHETADVMCKGVCDHYSYESKSSWKYGMTNGYNLSGNIVLLWKMPSTVHGGWTVLSRTCQMLGESCAQENISCALWVNCTLIKVRMSRAQWMNLHCCENIPSWLVNPFSDEIICQVCRSRILK